MLKKNIVLLLIFFTLSVIFLLSYHSQYIIVNLQEMSMMKRNYSKQFVMDHMYPIEVTTGSLNLKTETLAKSITKQYIHQTKCRGRCVLRESSEDRLQKSKSCPDPSPHLVGPFRVEFSTPRTLNSTKNENPNVTEGGRYQPDDCIALQKVAIIIPFRKRHEHLKFWIHYLHPVLQRQQLDYGIYVINQDGDGTFNRAKLMNIGYAEALKEYDYDCFVFSDVDLIPMDDRNAYKCFSQPRHLSVAVDSMGFRLPYNNIFGGVTALNKEQYQKINGFPNDYWGWGGEDDDIFNRITLRGMTLSRPDSLIGKYRMIKHNRDTHNEPNPQRFDRLRHTTTTINSDGINSLKYTVVKLEKGDLFTTVTVDVGTP